MPPIPARLIAFVAAVTFTYVFNRAFTFSDRPAGTSSRWIAYAIASVIGAIANIGAFIVAIMILDGWSLAPYVAMPIGVAAGLAVNFLAYNFVVFREGVDMVPQD